MIIQRKIYQCTNCSTIFAIRKLAEQHEKKCDKCNTCQYAYYVYGCQFSCKYYDLNKSDKDKCNQELGYPKYKQKTSTI